MRWFFCSLLACALPLASLAQYAPPVSPAGVVLTNGAGGIDMLGNLNGGGYISSNFLAHYLFNGALPDAISSSGGLLTFESQNDGLPRDVVVENLASTYDMLGTHNYPAGSLIVDGVAVHGSDPSTNLVNALSFDRSAYAFSTNGAGDTICTISNSVGNPTLTYYFNGAPVSYAMPSNLTMIAGTTNTLQVNWLYATPSGLAVSGTQPTGTRALVARFMLSDGASTAANGPMLSHRFSEWIVDADGVGRVARGDERLRILPAEWVSGVDVSLTTNVNGAAEDDLYITTGSGQAYQFHPQTVAAVSGVGTESYCILNDPNIGKRNITNLNQIAVDAEGNSVLDNNNSYFNIEMLRTVPSGTDQVAMNIAILLSEDDYPSLADALADSDNLSVTSVDPNLRPTIFRIATITLNRLSSGGGTWSAVVQRRHGEPVGRTGGGSGSSAASTVFSAGAFRVHDSTDPTKLVALDAAGLTTATTRTITIPDADGTMAFEDTVFPNITLQGQLGTNLVLQHVFQLGTNFLGINMVGGSSTSLYPAVESP